MHIGILIKRRHTYFLTLTALAFLFVLVGLYLLNNPVKRRRPEYYLKQSLKPLIEIYPEDHAHQKHPRNFSRDRTKPKVFSTSRRAERKTQDPLPPVDPRGYVAYLPHSGFSNQRIELENAFLAAYALNRTLIVPPLYLGHDDVLSWREFPYLRFQLKEVETTNYNRLFFQGETEELLKSFLSPHNSLALVPWSALLNLSALHDHVRTISVADFVDLNLLKSMNDILIIPDFERYAYKLVDEFPGANIGVLVDNETNDLKYKLDSRTKAKDDRDSFFVMFAGVCRYSKGLQLELTSGYYDQSLSIWSSLTHELQDLDTNATKYFDSEYKLDKCASSAEEFKLIAPLDTTEFEMFDLGKVKMTQIPLGKYNHFINLGSLWNAPTLVHFGSLFGSGRIGTINESNKLFKQKIEEAFVLSNEFVIKAGESIIKEIGGAGSYVSLHVRVGDGHFKNKARETVGRAFKILNVNSEQFSLNEGMSLTLFIATDCPKSERADMFKELYSISTKIVYLDDFTDIITNVFKDIDSWRLKNLENISSEWESEMSLLLNQVDILFTKQDKDRKFDWLTQTAYIKGLFTSMARYLLKEQKASKEAETKKTPISTFGELWVPFVEQYVCSRGSAVIGTKSSTFSDFIYRLHRVYWKEADPNKVVFIEAA